MLRTYVVVSVPMLEDLPAPAEPKPPFRWTAPRVAAVSSTAVGVIGLGIAAGLALAAKAEHNHALGETAMPTQQTIDSTSAYREGNVASGFAIAGGALAAAGIVLWLAAPKAKVRITLSGAALVLGGSF